MRNMRLKINYIRESDEKFCIQNLALPKKDYGENRMEKIMNKFFRINEYTLSD